MRARITRAGERCCQIAERIFPDPFVLAILLTAVAGVLALIFTDATPSDVLAAWQGPKGFWSLLTFGMQMCLILITGHALASSPPVARLIHRLASLPQTTATAAAMVAFVAMSCGLINWGLGLIVGALLAVEVGRAAKRNGTPIHYPLVVAAGYTGLLVWHGGLSGSAPLKSTTAAELLDIVKDPALVAQIVGQPQSVIANASPVDLAQLTAIPLTDSIFSQMNLVVTAALLVVIPAVFMLLAPRPEDCVPVPEAVCAPTPKRTVVVDTVVRRLERSRLLAWATAAFAAYVVVDKLWSGGSWQLDLNTMNLTFLALGLAMHGSPVGYAQAIGDGARSTAGILLQFPFYAGIMGIMAHTGLATELASAISAAATATTLPILTFISAGVVNLFIPSGGGQWAVQGPIVLQAAVDLGTDPAKLLMALSYGDELTNMLQPFWALPLLGITGLQAGKIMGYTALVMCVATAIFITALTVL